MLLCANVTTSGALCARRRSPRAAESRHVDDLLLSPLFLSRVQFAFVISFHILFPAFTIGLAHWLAFLEWRWLRTRESLWRDLYFFWLKIFAVSFGMRSEEHTSELQSLMRISYAVFCLKNKRHMLKTIITHTI